jgi:hypothetical protein
MQTAAHNFRALIKGIRTGRLIAMAQRYWEFARADQAVISRYGLVVRDGIFAGMQYARFPPGHHVAAKVLGVYERETAEFLRDAMRRSYDVIVNVGCAEGYYAVGLARHFANAKVFAFDIQRREQAFCARLAELERRERARDRGRRLRSCGAGVGAVGEEPDHHRLRGL